MKRITLIIIGILILLLLGGVWIFSLLYGSPERSDLFANFNFFGSNDEPVGEPVPEVPTEEPAPVPVVPAQLRQLTTRPVIGWREQTETAVTESSTTTDIYILYVEAGTGHVYKKNITTYDETRVSNITIPAAQHAVISRDGGYVAIRSGYGSRNEVALLSLKSDPVQNETLPYQIGDFSFTDRDTLLFTESTATSETLVKEIALDTKSVSTRYTIPFQAATIIWSATSSMSHYVYPKTASLLPGALYELSGGSVKRLPVSGTGFSAVANSNQLVYWNRSQDTYTTHSYSLLANTTVRLPLSAVAEKCAIGLVKTVMYCGYDLGAAYDHNFPDNWYKGTVGFADRIWRLDLTSGSMRQLINPEQLIGRTIDMINPTLNPTETHLYFLNKTDSALWLYEL